MKELLGIFIAGFLTFAVGNFFGWKKANDDMKSAILQGRVSISTNVSPQITNLVVVIKE